MDILDYGYFGLWIMDYGLWFNSILDYGYFGLWIMDYGLWFNSILDYGLRIMV